MDYIDLCQLGFMVSALKTEGRLAFESKLFLKIYLYGYLNGIRSSRRLEKECIRNVELHWLENLLQPTTIRSRFSEREPDGAKNVFKLFVLFLKEADLIGGTTQANERIHGNCCICFCQTDSRWAA